MNFNPRSHERSDDGRQEVISKVETFQSTLPREERLLRTKELILHLQDFNPRSHERSDSFWFWWYEIRLISIHAPTRGATQCQKMVVGCLVLFQSTLPREERLYSPLEILPIKLISIHAPTRGATGRLSKVTVLDSISIHAPTRGATFLTSNTEQNFVNFNPRSHERSD